MSKVSEEDKMMKKEMVKEGREARDKMDRAG